MEPMKEPTKENPVIAGNYPYGFKRTQKKYWIETKKGQRVVSQTLNPKTDVWNAEKKSTYSDIKVLYFDNGHIENTSLDFGYDGEKELKEFIKTFGTVLTDYQLKRLLVFKAIIKTRESVKVTITDNPDKEKQEKAKQELKKIFIKNLAMIK